MNAIRCHLISIQNTRAELNHNKQKAITKHNKNIPAKKKKQANKNKAKQNKKKDLVK